MYIFNGRLKSDFTVGIAKSIHVQPPQMLKKKTEYIISIILSTSKI